MDKSSSPKRKMTNFKFFLIVLVITAVAAFAAGFLSSDEEVVLIGLEIAIVISVYLTLFRILKNSNDPDNRLGSWKYFFALSIFVTGILVAVSLLITKDEETIPLGILLGITVSAVVSLIRGIKHRHQERKAEKERDKQYQEQLVRKNRQYADELARKERAIQELQSRNSELLSSRRSSPSVSSSSYQSQYREEMMERQREQMRKQEEDERKKERLDDWYREYVTIDVDFEYHVRDSEYNQDYWDPRNEEIRVSRREAMALIQAGESAILNRLGYSNGGLIRNFRYQAPYGLYDRPWGC